MFKYFKRIGLESRRIRWSNNKKNWKTFFISLVLITIFALILGMFTWGINLWFSQVS